MKVIKITMMIAVLTLTSLACTQKKSVGNFGDTPSSQPGVRVKEVKKQEIVKKAPNFAEAMTIEKKYNSEKKMVEVVLNIKEGFHAYAVGETTGIPVALSIAPENGWMMKGVANIPAGKEKDLGELGKSLILEGKVALSAEIESGKGEVKGHVSVQICSDESCDRPRKHAFALATK